MQETSAPLRFNDQIREWLQPALDRGGTHAIEDIEKEVATGHMQLWVGERGAAVTQILDFPRKKVLHVFLAGGEMDQITDFQESAWIWGQSQGCTAMTLSGRLGWKRVLRDWTAKSVEMEFTG